MLIENKRVGNVIVHKFEMLPKGSGRVIFGAYEASSYFGDHSSLMTIEGQTCGSIASRRIPAEIDALPVGPVRWEALDAFRAANLREAFAAILAAFPEAVEGRRDALLGAIEVES